MRKKELNEIIRKLEVGRDRLYETMAVLRDSDHPEHQRAYERASGRADGFDAALEALRGNQVFLDIWARED